MTELDEYQLFIQERLRAYDSSISLETGSPADLQIVQPLLRRYGEDPLQVDTELFLKTLLGQKYPDLYLGEGSPFVDLVIKPMRLLLDPLVREVRSVKRNQSLIDPTVLNKDEADALVSNVFISRALGDYARVKIRIYFKHPVSVTLGTYNVAFTATGRRFIPVSAQRLSSEAMLFNQEGDLFYFDASFVSEARGEAYNIGPSEITGITGLPAAIRVTNLRAAEQGSDEMSTVQLVNWAEQSVGERSLTAIPGIVNRLFQSFPSLRLLQVIGFGDLEMQRDVITGGSLGEVVVHGLTGATSDDGDADGYTPYFDAAGATFTLDFGPVGTDLSAYALTVFGPTEPYDFTLGEVKGATRLSIADDYTLSDRLPDNLSARPYTIRKREILLSDLPGGLVNPTNEARVTIEPDEIHIGGCTDFYVMGGVNSIETLVLETAESYEPVLRGPIGETTASSRQVVLTGVSLSERDDALACRVLHILDGTDVGVYQILSSSYNSGASELTVLLDSVLTATDTGVLCALSLELSVPLIDPMEVLAQGSDLRTYAGASFVDTGSGRLWADFGVSGGHYLEVLAGSDIGTYTISSAVGTLIHLTGELKKTDDPISYRVIRRQAAALSRPLARVTKVELLDANLEPTGNVIPYGLPIDCRSRSFQNPGRGAKAGTFVPTTDDALAVTAGSAVLTSDNTALNYYDLGVRPGDIVNVLTGNNIGFYTVASDGVGGSAAADPTLDDFELKVTSALSWTDPSMSYAVGEPSYGSFRLYFLDPTLATVGAQTRFTVTVGGVERRFLPDPTVRAQLLPTEVVEAVATTTASSPDVSLTDLETSVVVYSERYSVEVGDRVEITYVPIIGSLDHGSTNAAVNGKTLLFDLGDGPERVRFIGDLSITALVDQINSQLSREVAYKYEVGGAKYLGFRSSQEAALLDNSADADDATALVFGTNPALHQPWVTAPAFAGQTIDNDSPDRGYWYVTSRTADVLTLADGSGTAFNPTYSIPIQFLVVTQLGVQRIFPSDMASQQDDLGLYYFDVECISEGHGDEWNIEADLQATVSPRPSAGWRLEVADDRLSYSMAEEVSLLVDPFIVFEASANDPTLALPVVGESIEVTYEKAALVEEIHSFVTSVRERVTTQSPLVRSLFPVFVRSFANYGPYPTESEARSAWSSAIRAIAPSERLEVSDLTYLLRQKGATYVQLPIELIGLSYQADRSILVERSEDHLEVGRLSGFLPDDDGETAEGASWLLFHRS